MYRYSSRSLLRSAPSSLRNAQPSSRRLLSTAPPHQKSRSWKNSALRWGVAIAGVYYYNTSPVFADNTKRIMRFDTDPHQDVEEQLPTVESYASTRKQQQGQAVDAPLPPTSEGIATDDPAALEEEADSQGAFNPVTGEINWDCPCLGGMAHGPCGQDFRNAFSCFVYSEQEPKGLDCIDKFKAMQDCFRDHPDIYAAELEDDEAELDAELAKERGSAPSQGTDKRLLDDEPTSLPLSPILSADAPPTRREPVSKPSKESSPQQHPASVPTSPAPHVNATDAEDSPNEHSQPVAAAVATAKDHLSGSTPTERAKIAQESTAKSAEKFDEGLELMPKAWHDGTSASEETTGERKSK